MPNKKIFKSTSGITAKQLAEVMKYHLDSFNNEGVAINNATIHNNVLSDSDGPTPTTGSKQMYKGIMRWTIQQNGGQDKSWPNNWMDISVEALSKALV